jgi:tetratricopeptide (TPR) repeat protein
MKVKINLLLLLVIAANSLAQEFAVTNYRKGLNIKLNINDEKRLEKGVEILNDALTIENEALSIFKVMSDTERIAGISPDYNKAIKKLLQASELYKEGHSLLYIVYTENCGKFVDVNKKLEHYASGINKAKYYEQKGEKTYNKTLKIREIILMADKPEWVQYKMHEALELEKLAIRDKGRALNIYHDFPVEYDYKWDDDISPEQLAEIFKNPIVNVPTEEVFKKKPVTDTIPKEEAVVFRVQIAAHTVQIKDDFIRTFYTGKEAIQEINENKWYKYQIGSFDNYASADSLQKICRVPRAFVVAYQNGIKLTIKDALRKLQNAQ